ncbi:MAG: hypothetical protein ACSHWW_06630 [Nonlabens sp.]|uniref:hypothetical protein n=1 Tax=Nonlabens sp. TaxID=1888209 RepID=UPI003EF2BB40
MKKISLIIFLICFQFVSCQDYGKLTLLEHLPETLEEISGMEIVPDNNLLFAINDSGNAPKVYLYDRESGLYTIESEQLENQDWEDLALYNDSISGRTLLYVSDTGNNRNKRKDLAIYELDITNINKQDYTRFEVRSIPFEYENQKKFPPKKKNRIYDCEALIRNGEYFYLFSKNRSKDFNGKTQVYRLKVDGTSQTAEFLTDIEICNDNDDCLITSADINSKGDIALLTSDKVFIINNYDVDFNEFDIKRYDLNHSSQKESVIFKEDDLLWISDEQRKNTGGNLYEFKLED